MLFNGFYTFPSRRGKGFDVNDFVTAYIGIPIYAGLYLFWKIFKRTKWIRAEEADIHTGKAEMDEADKFWPERRPRTWVQRVWYAIA